MKLHRHALHMAAIAILGLGALPSQAQQTMQLQFITFPVTMMPLEVELYAGEGETVKLEVPSTSMSEPVTIPRLTKLVFGKTEVDKDGKPTFKIYGNGAPAATRKQIVLILRKGNTMADGIAVRAVPSDMDGFGGGKLLFLNATNMKIGGNAGQVPFGLVPGKQAIVKPQLEKNGRLTYVEFFYVGADNKPVPFFNSKWPMRDNRRGLVFFFQNPNDPNPNNIQLHTIEDFLLADG